MRVHNFQQRSKSYIIARGHLKKNSPRINMGKLDEFSTMLLKVQNGFSGKKLKEIHCNVIFIMINIQHQWYIYLTVNVVLISHRKWRIHSFAWMLFFSQRLRQGHTPPPHVSPSRAHGISWKLSSAYLNTTCTIAKFHFRFGFRRKHQNEMQKSAIKFVSRSICRNKQSKKL